MYITHQRRARPMDQFLRSLLSTTRLPHLPFFNHTHLTGPTIKEDDAENLTIKQPHGSLSRSEISLNRTVQCMGGPQRQDIRTP